MIRIGETHRVCVPWDCREFWSEWAEDEDATEAVKRQIDAHENLLIAIGMGWDLDGVIEQSKAALAPFTESDASLVDSGLRSCATPKAPLGCDGDCLPECRFPDQDCAKAKGDQHG